MLPESNLISEQDRKIISDYLNKYSHPLSAQIAAECFYKPHAFDSCVVIPCYHESELLPGCLTALDKAALHSKQTVLVVVVVNNKLNDSKEHIADGNLCLDICNSFKSHSQGKFGIKVFAVDCCADLECMFSAKEGVGDARKLGCDIALHLLIQGAIQSRWLRNTDCDVLVGLDYFSQNLDSKCADAVCEIEEFVHVPVDPTAESWRALELYDAWLRYYVAGLQFAGSPYAFQTVGSTINCEAVAYAKVRGFPRRMAGEDFYLISKLSKIGEVVTSKRSPIEIQDRESARVPFGTGVGVAKIMSQLCEGKPYLVINPKSFAVLKTFLGKTNKLYQEGYSCLDATEAKVATILGCESALQHCRQHGKTLESFTSHFHQWFDALKTLRFLHLLAEIPGFEDVELSQAQIELSKMQDLPTPISNI